MPKCGVCLLQQLLYKSHDVYLIFPFLSDAPLRSLARRRPLVPFYAYNICPFGVTTGAGQECESRAAISLNVLNFICMFGKCAAPRSYARCTSIKSQAQVLAGILSQRNGSVSSSCMRRKDFIVCRMLPVIKLEFRSRCCNCSNENWMAFSCCSESLSSADLLHWHVFNRILLI